MFVFIRQDSAAGFFRFCSSFSCLPAAAVLFRPVFLPPRPFCPKSIRLDVACGSYRKKGISGNFPMFHAGNTPIHAETSCVLPPPCYIKLSKQPLFSGSPIHVVVRVGRDGGALPCPVPIYYRIYVIGGILNGLLSQTRHARPGACSGAFRQEKGISPSPHCRTTDRSSRSRLCHDDRHGPSCFCRYV